MKQAAQKLREVEKTLSKDRGSFDLFALFLREDAPGVWDLVVAGEWIEKDRPGAIREISKRVQKALTRKQMTRLSRVVIIDQANPALHALSATIGVEHGLAEVKDSTFFDLTIKEAFIITSRVRKAA
jgi:hypothetical protein